MFSEKLAPKRAALCLLTALCASLCAGVAADESFREFRFVVEPSDTVAVRSRPAMLDCSLQNANGASPQIEWLREGAALNLDNRRFMFANGSLYLEQVEHSKTNRPDEGFYQCSGKVDGLGTLVSRKARFDVAYLGKTFTEEPGDVRVHLGDVAMLPCRMDASPSPSVRWYKDDQQLHPDLSSFHIVHADGMLEIQKVQFADFGRYKCRVENVERSKMSEEAELSQNSDPATYQGVAPHFIREPSNQVAVEGTSVMMYCGANGRDIQANPPTLTWLKDGVTVELGTRLSTVGSGSLRIDSLQLEDAGLYTCRATNQDDSIDAVATLTVHVPPRFLARPKNLAAQVNMDAELECDVAGVPKPTITWMKNGDVVISSDYFQIIEGRNLRILGLVNTDAGMYQCMAENIVGSVQASAQLIVTQPAGSTHSVHSLWLTTPPSPEHQAPSVSHDLPSEPTYLVAVIIQERFVTLSWQPPNHPGTSEVTSYGVFWKEAGSDRERTLNTSALEANVQHLKPGTQYDFRVLGYNRAGPSSSAAAMTIHTPEEVDVPGEPTDLEATVLSQNSIKLDWSPPADSHGGIINYKLFYYEVGADGEHEVDVVETEYVLEKLEEYHQYSFRVVACNRNGAGTSTPEAMVRTFSDKPSEPPQNVTIETSSSTSLVLRWEPPPEEDQNGRITGYKIRYKKRGEQGSSVTTDGNRRMYALTELSRGVEYQLRIQALTVNGTGPATDWLSGETYMHDLDETSVPGQPSSLQVRPMTNSIVVSWTPPVEQDILIRGYILGYGIGVPDIYKQVLDPKQRYHTIKNLKPSSQYVISLRAFNNIGEGRQIYETTFTRYEAVEEAPTPMTPPVGLRAIVLSSSTIVLTWTDTTLGRNQRVTDNRFYTVRYNPTSSRKHRALNSTSLNTHIDGLKPNTDYEFSVKVLKGRRQSTWSLSAFNKTFETAPATAPRDLTPIGVIGHPTMVQLNWQPPRLPNGQITGYLVFYTTDATQKDRDWVVEGVLGEKLSANIRDLTPETTYYFKVQARNSKGYGPMSPTVIFRTPRLDGTGGGMIELPDDHGQPHLTRGDVRLKQNWNGQSDWDDQKRAYDLVPKSKEQEEESGGIPPMVLWISIGCIGAVSVIAVIVVTIIMCRKRNENDRRNRKGGAYKKAPVKPGPKDLKPPDLWIHHEGMELKNIEKANSDGTMVVTPLPRDGEDPGGVSYDPLEDDRYKRNPIRPKPIMIPVDQAPPPREPIATAITNGHLVTADGCTPIRPMYPRTNSQFANSTPRVNAGDISQPSSEDQFNSSSTLERRKDRTKRGSRTGAIGPPSPNDLDSPSFSNQHIPISYEQLQMLPGQPSPSATTSGYSSGSDSGKGTLQLRGRLPHPLRSFTVPGPPDPSSPSPNPSINPSLLKKQIVRPQPQQPTSPNPTSPYKKPAPPPGSRPDVTLKAGASDDFHGSSDLTKSFSTEELTAEMANLEGLMKDLNAITQQEFEC